MNGGQAERYNLLACILEPLALFDATECFLFHSQDRDASWQLENLRTFTDWHPFYWT